MEPLRACNIHRPSGLRLQNCRLQAYSCLYHCKATWTAPDKVLEGPQPGPPALSLSASMSADTMYILFSSILLRFNSRNFHQHSHQPLLYPCQEIYPSPRCTPPWHQRRVKAINSLHAGTVPTNTMQSYAYPLGFKRRNVTRSVFKSSPRRFGLIGPQSTNESSVTSFSHLLSQSARRPYNSPKTLP